MYVFWLCEKKYEKNSYNINKKFSNTLQDCISFLHFSWVYDTEVKKTKCHDGIRQCVTI